MLGFKRIVIAEHERGIHLKEGSLVNILGAGVYRFWDPQDKHRVIKQDLTNPEFSNPQLDIWLRQQEALFQQHFQIVETTAEQIGLVYKNNHLQQVLLPDSRVLYWRDAVTMQVTLLDISKDFRIEKKLATYLRFNQQKPQFRTLMNYVQIAEVAAQQVGLLYVEGELQDTLLPGIHAFWMFHHSIRLESIDLRMQSIEVQGQEILTKDKVSLRINLSANYRVADAVTARSQLGEYVAYLYRTLQFALRQVVATRTLDELLGDKAALDAELFKPVCADLGRYGVEVVSLGVKDVILPGDMKDILNQVVSAEKIAQANVIRRREETAATRSLLNTAKLMDENPTLLRLKELETLEKVTERIGNLTVFGGLDGVLDSLVRIKR